MVTPHGTTHRIDAHLNRSISESLRSPMPLKTLKYIVHHPLNCTNRLAAISRFIRWQLGSRLLPFPIIYPLTNRTQLAIHRGMSGATGNIYCGLHEYAEMAFAGHLLREDDLFVDVGANVGSYTILAAGHTKARVVSFEPIAATYRYLQLNIAINDLGDRVTAYNLGVGAEQSFLKFVEDEDCKNRVSPEGTTSVCVRTLDQMIQGYPTLIKVDVEGFESSVMTGARSTLANTMAVIIELGGDDASVTHAKMLELGFQSFRYDPVTRNLMQEDYFTNNVIYVRDIQFVSDRLRTADAIQIRPNCQL